MSGAAVAENVTIVAVPERVGLARAFVAGVLGGSHPGSDLAALVPARTTTAQVRQFAAGLDAHAAEFQQMRGMMGQWGHAAPAPYTPGATPPPGTGPGMTSTSDWDEMGRMHGADFNGHFADAMIANRTAEIALCRTELAKGASPQAQALARSMLSQWQAKLIQLQTWHNQWQQGTGPGMMSGSRPGGWRQSGPDASQFAVKPATARRAGWHSAQSVTAAQAGQLSQGRRLPEVGPMLELSLPGVQGDQTERDERPRNGAAGHRYSAAGIRSAPAAGGAR